MDTFVIVQRLNAGFDKNGNRRAIYCVYDRGGNLIEVHKYNFQYPEKIHQHHAEVINLPAMDVKPSELKEWIKAADLSSHCILFD